MCEKPWWHSKAAVASIDDKASGSFSDVKPLILQTRRECVEFGGRECEALYLDVRNLWVVIFDLPQHPQQAVPGALVVLQIKAGASLREAALLREPLGGCD